MVRVAGTAIALLLNVVLARTLTADAFGRYNFVLACAGLLALVAQAGLEKAAIRFIPETTAKGEQADAAAFVRWSTRWIARTAMLVALVIALALAIADPGEGVWGSFWPCVVLFPLLALLQFWQQVLRGYRRIVASQVLEQLLLPMLLVFLVGVAVWQGVESDAVWVLVLHALVVGALGWWAWREVGALVGPARHAHRSTAEQSRAWLSVALPLGAAGVMSFVLARGEIILLGFVLEPEDVARYAVALKISNLLAFGLTAANAIGGPVFSAHFHAGENLRLQGAATQTAWIALAISLPVLIGIALFPELIVSLFGTQYAAAAVLLLILSAGQLVNVLSGPVGPLLSVSGQQWFYLRVLGVVSVVKLLAIVPVAMVFGTEGVAVVAALARVAWCVWLAVGAVRLIGILPTIGGVWWSGRLGRG